MDNNPWYTRGYLPHFDDKKTTQFITFCLFDSIPKWKRLELNRLVRTKIFAEKMHNTYDQGYGSCLFKDCSLADIVRNALFHFDGVRYVLHAWVIMPNHVHLLITPLVSYQIHNLVGSLKSYTALNINKKIGRTGSVWQRDYFDTYIRSEKHFNAVKNYIEYNPVKAGLCHNPEDWRFSSAYQFEDGEKKSFLAKR